MAEHNILGLNGEQLAQKVMTEKGYRVLETNWRLGHLEIDIICESKTELVFVEVKTRSSIYGMMRPEQYVDEQKKRHMVAAANTYMRVTGKTDKTIRFDIIGILKKRNGETDITHLENAFVPRLKSIGAGHFTGEWRHHDRTAYSNWRRTR